MIFKEDIFIGKALHFRAIPQCSQMYTTVTMCPEKSPPYSPCLFFNNSVKHQPLSKTFGT